MKKILSLIVVIVLLLGTLCACDKPFDYTDLSVRDYTGKHGIVTAANPYAAKIGLDVLQAGGNAFDAAVAVSFALGVAECDATGLGGGGIMIAYNINTKESLYYNFREFAPENVPTKASDYTNLSENHCRVTAVPTQVAGLLTILEEQGTFTRQQILQPSINLARQGVVVTPELGKNILNATKIYDGRNAPADVLPFQDELGLFPISEGETIYQENLAKSLEYVAEYGKEGFYTGELAQKIVDASTANGGSISMADMKYALDNYPKKGTPISGNYKGYDVYTTATPSTGGTMLIEMLNMLECYDGELTSLGHNSAEYVNLLATVMQLAYGDKEQYMADSNVVDVPVKGLTDKGYAETRFSKYTAGHAYLGTATDSVELPYGNPWAFNGTQGNTYDQGSANDHYSTTSFSVIDKDGNIVTFTQTINNFFGCGVMPTGTGFFLNDEMRDFNLTDSGSINFVAPHKQPASYMAPTVILKDGKPYATIGTPGGSRIPSALLQVVLNMVEFDMDVQSAINAPRFYCLSTDESNRNDTAKVIYIEQALKNLQTSLTAMGYKVEPTGEGQIDSRFGGVQGIRVEKKGYHGGADPRRDGKALGY